MVLAVSMITINGTELALARFDSDLNYHFTPHQPYKVSRQPKQVQEPLNYRDSLETIKERLNRPFKTLHRHHQILRVCAEYCPNLGRQSNYFHYHFPFLFSAVSLLSLTCHRDYSITLRFSSLSLAILLLYVFNVASDFAMAVLAEVILLLMRSLYRGFTTDFHVQALMTTFVGLYVYSPWLSFVFNMTIGFWSLQRTRRKKDFELPKIPKRGSRKV